MNRFRPVPVLFLFFSLCFGCGGGGGTDTAAVDEIVVGTECVSSSECDDGNSCTRDKCNRGFCSSEEIVCDDSDPCTDDSCLEGSCRFDRRKNCCETDEDCDDGDQCTVGDRCDRVSKTCVIAEPADPCCRTDRDCDDSDVCTTDTCQTNLLCGHRWEITSLNRGQCCNSDADCADSDHCTSDKCVITDGSVSPPRGRCRHEVLCCKLDSDCVDGDSPCLAGDCIMSSGTGEGECGYEWIEGCCVSVGDCPERLCTTVGCTGGQCSWTAIPGCCSSDADCGSDECLFCEKGEGQTGTCELRAVQGCCFPTVYFESFDGGTGVVVGPMPSGPYSSTPSWHVSGRRYASPPSSLFFGDEETGLCRGDGTLKTGGRAVTTSIPLMKTRKPVLSFQMFKQTDEISRYNDVVSIYVLSAAGEKKVFSTRDMAVFNSGPSFSTFPGQPVSLEEWAGESVSIIIEYDSVSYSSAGYEGVYIDDLAITGTCD